MPTGYTAKLMESGETFQDFVMHCARAFGALVTMRDDDSDTPIPEEFKPNDYYLKALERSKKEHAELLAMTESQRFAFGRKRKEEAIKSSRDYIAKALVEDNRLNEMKASVVQWEPPTKDHKGLKEFMLEQIKISMNGTTYTEKTLVEEEAKSPMDFWNSAEKIARENIPYYQKEHDKEIERCKGRTEWVNQLRDSLAAGVK